MNPASNRTTPRLAIFAGLAMAAPAYAQLEMSWHSIDCGGVTLSTSRSFALGGTIGQWDATATVSGPTLELTGGFWPVAAAAVPPLPGDMNCDGVLDFFDIDPFLLALFDPAAYQSAYPACDIDAADVSGDGSIDFFDIDPFLNCLFNGPCP